MSTPTLVDRIKNDLIMLSVFHGDKHIRSVKLDKDENKPWAIKIRVGSRDKSGTGSAKISALANCIRSIPTDSIVHFIRREPDGSIIVCYHDQD